MPSRTFNHAPFSGRVSMPAPPSSPLQPDFEPLDLAPGEPAVWYRLMFLDRPVGPWRSSSSEVHHDALETGNASISKRYRRVFITSPAWIACVDLANGSARAI